MKTCRYFFFYVSFIFIFPFPAASQEISSKEKRSIFNEAESILLYNEDYEKALPLYHLLADLVPGNHNYQYKVGICYLNIDGYVRQSIPWLLRASEKTTFDYSYNYKEDKAPVDVLFYIGSAYHILNRTDSAVYYYKKFLSATSRFHNPEMFYNGFVRQQIKNCGHALEMEQHPVTLRKERLPDRVNAYRKNLYPLLSGNRKVLVFTAMPGSNQAIMVCHKEKGEWSRPVDITGELNAGDDSRGVALSYTGDTLFLYKEEGGKADLWVSYHRDTIWTPMKRLGRNINTKYWESSCCISADGKTLYFTSNRDGGYGGLDIYMSRRTPDGRWGEAVNLGPTINTPLLEDNPHLTSDGQKIFFSSQGHYNMGGFDIFYSEKNKSGRWSKPVNLGYPVNNTDENRDYFPLGKGDTALVSLVTNSGFITRDIYKVHILAPGEVTQVELRGTLIREDGSGEADPALSVMITDTSGTKTFATLRPDPAGRYHAELAPGNYLLTVRSTRYREMKENLSIPDDYPRSFIAVETRLVPRQTGRGDIFFIRSIYFKQDEYRLSEEARQHLTRVATLLSEYPTLKFEIVGMTDTTGTEEYNRKLSVRRAKEVIRFFTGMGISRDRFSLYGIGEIKVVPVSKNKKQMQEIQARSRRVDIRLIRPDTTIRYKEEYFLPEYTAGKDKLTYSILVIKTKKKLPADYFYRFNMEELNYVRVDEVNGEYYYTLGSFKQKNRAIELLTKLIELGFSKARILDDPALEDLLHKTETVRKKEYVGRSEYIAEEIPYYTIQIYALHRAPHKGAFKNLKDIRVWACKDRFVRYTTGNYHGYSVAKKELPEIRKMGYHDAFIRPVSSLEELRKEKQE